MATEGEFPKINGDILYASEVNGFRPKLIGQLNGQGNSNPTSVSGTNHIIVGGSVVYDASAGRISNGILINGVCGKLGAVSTNYAIFMSGIGIDFIIGSSDSGNNNDTEILPVNCFVTSGAMTASGGNIGSDYVFFNKMKNNNDSSIGFPKSLLAIGF